jgi:endonuclease YncB( thermonuclease family)
MRILSLLRVLAAIVLIGAGSASAGPRPHDPWTATGRAVKIIDGDTFDLLTADRGLIRVRFGGMDAPERGQAFRGVRPSISDNCSPSNGSQSGVSKTTVMLARYATSPSTAATSA